MTGLNVADRLAYRCLELDQWLDDFTSVTDVCIDKKFNFIKAFSRAATYATTAEHGRFVTQAAEVFIRFP
jgi:hypothetical protein